MAGHILRHALILVSRRWTDSCTMVNTRVRCEGSVDKVTMVISKPMLITNTYLGRANQGHADVMYTHMVPERRFMLSAAGTVDVCPILPEEGRVSHHQTSACCSSASRTSSSGLSACNTISCAWCKCSMFRIHVPVSQLQREFAACYAQHHVVQSRCTRTNVGVTCRGQHNGPQQPTDAPWKLMGRVVTEDTIRISREQKYMLISSAAATASGLSNEEFDSRLQVRTAVSTRIQLYISYHCITIIHAGVRPVLVSAPIN